MSITTLPALQARSRKSLERLIKAAVDVLNKDGLEGATIPKIAARAKLSPGTVYRRFADKDALLREVCIRLFEQSNAQVQVLLRSDRWNGASLETMVRTIINITLKEHVDNRRLLRALSLFVKQHEDPAFVRKISELQWRGVLGIADLLLTRRPEIAHPDPEPAVKFALLMVGAMTQVVLILSDKPNEFARLLPDVEGTLKQELPTMFLRYLEIG